MKQSLAAITILLLAAANAAPALSAPEWKLPTALRLRVDLPGRGNMQVFLPLPRELSTMKSCRVFLDNGTEISATPLLSGKELLGFQLDFAGNMRKKETSTPAKPAASVYFLPDPAKPTPANPLRVKLTKRNRTLTTRAFTADEMRRLFDSDPKPAARFNSTFVKAIGDIPNTAEWKLPPNKSHITAVLQWETIFHIDKDATIAFGTNTPNTAWAIIVDGHDAADWYTANPADKGALLGSPCLLARGIHTVQLLAVQKANEKLPDCVVSVGGAAPVPLTPLAAPGAFRYIALEYKDKTSAAASVSLGPRPVFSMFQTGQSIALTHAIIRGTASLNAPDGTPISLNGGTALHDAAFIAGITLGTSPNTITFPARPRWSAGTRTDSRARLQNIPPICAAHEEITADLLFTAPTLPEPLRSAITTNMSVVDATGNTLATLSAKPNADGLSHFSFKRPEGGVRALFDVQAVGLFLAPPTHLTLLSPDMADDELAVSGGSVFSHGIRAVLVCAPLHKESISGAPGAPGGTVPRPIALLDDFAGVSFAPQATQPVGDVLRQAIPGEKLIQHFAAGRRHGTAGRLGSIAALPDLLAARPGTAILMTGCSALREGEPPARTCLPTLFILQASIAHGILPILVAMPPLPGISRADARLAALYTKELALAAGVPSIDLFSPANAEGVNTDAWFKIPGTGIAAPDNHSRQWMSKHAAKALARLTSKGATK